MTSAQPSFQSSSLLFSLASVESTIVVVVPPVALETLSWPRRRSVSRRALETVKAIYPFFRRRPILRRVLASAACRFVVAPALLPFFSTLEAYPATDFPAFFAFFVKAPGLLIAPCIQRALFFLATITSRTTCAYSFESCAFPSSTAWSWALTLWGSSRCAPCSPSWAAPSPGSLARSSSRRVSPSSRPVVRKSSRLPFRPRRRRAAFSSPDFAFSSPDFVLPLFPPPTRRPRAAYSAPGITGIEKHALGRAIGRA